MERYVIYDRRIPNETLRTHSDIGEILAMKLDLLKANISLRPYLAVMERMTDGTTREVKPPPWIQELPRGGV